VGCERRQSLYDLWLTFIPKRPDLLTGIAYERLSVKQNTRLSDEMTNEVAPTIRNSRFGSRSYIFVA
jgi:hypothetical protein